MKERTKKYIEILLQNRYKEIIPNVKWEKLGYSVNIDMLELLNEHEFNERLNEVNNLILGSWKSVDFNKVMNDHANWVKIFGERTPLSPLMHLREEIEEVIASPHDIIEYADCALLLFDALKLAGYTIRDLEIAMSAKLQINKGREWIQIGDGETKHWKHKQEVKQ